MSKIRLSTLLVGAMLALFSCDRSSDSVATPPASPAGPTARADLRIDLGPVGVLGRSQQMALRKLHVQMTSTGNNILRDTIDVSGASQVRESYTLLSDLGWSLLVTGLDEQDSVLYSGTKDFRLGAGTVNEIAISLEARYSSVNVSFPYASEVREVRYWVDGAAWGDSVLGSGLGNGDQVVLNRDYLSASGGTGTVHRFLFQALGSRGDKDTVIYELDTTMSVVSGVAQNSKLALRRVGQTSRASLLIRLGTLAQFRITTSYPQNMACGEWTDRSPEFLWNNSIAYGTLCDPRDGQTYRTIDIAGKTLMAENLNWEGPTGYQAGACYADDTANCRKYGRLYDILDPVLDGGFCPEGWHVPSAVEFEEIGITSGSGSDWLARSVPSAQGDLHGFRGHLAGVAAVATESAGTPVLSFFGAGFRGKYSTSTPVTGGGNAELSMGGYGVAFWTQIDSSFADGRNLRTSIRCMKN